MSALAEPVAHSPIPCVPALALQYGWRFLVYL